MPLFLNNHWFSIGRGSRRISNPVFVNEVAIHTRTTWNGEKIVAGFDRIFTILNDAGKLPARPYSSVKSPKSALLPIRLPYPFSSPKHLRKFFR